MVTTPQHVAHFAINADDIDVARSFYSAVLGWSFEPWGPPMFFHIVTSSGGEPGLTGALQARRDLGGRIRGFECTIAVDDVEATAAAVVAAGGTVLMERTTITGVGDLVWLEDPSGNVFGAMRYDTAAE